MDSLPCTPIRYLVLVVEQIRAVRKVDDAAPRWYRHDEKKAEKSIDDGRHDFGHAVTDAGAELHIECPLRAGSPGGLRLVERCHRGIEIYVGSGRKANAPNAHQQPLIDGKYCRSDTHGNAGHQRCKVLGQRHLRVRKRPSSAVIASGYFSIDVDIPGAMQGRSLGAECGINVDALAQPDRKGYEYTTNRHRNFCRDQLHFMHVGYDILCIAGVKRRGHAGAAEELHIGVDRSIRPDRSIENDVRMIEVKDHRGPNLDPIFFLVNLQPDAAAIEARPCLHLIERDCGYLRIRYRCGRETSQVVRVKRDPTRNLK